MKKLFEPIKLRDNSRERVLRELISYNESKVKDESLSESLSKNFSDNNKSQRELKPYRRKKASIIMEILAGAAVIALIAGIISVSVNKAGKNTHQPAQNTNQQNIAEKVSDNNSNQNNSLQGALAVDTPMIEFISNEKLGISIAFNRQCFKDYKTDDSSIVLYQDDSDTVTGFTWNNIQITASVYSYEEEVYNWAYDRYDHAYGKIQNADIVTLGELTFDYLSSINMTTDYTGFPDYSSQGIQATKFSFGYELSDVNTTECTDIYIIDSKAYSDTYGAYIIKASYQIYHNDNKTEYSTNPKFIYETIDSFSFTTYTKKTFYILANGTYSVENSLGQMSNQENFSTHYNTGYNTGSETDGSFYSMLVSSVPDKADDYFNVNLPARRLYDAAGIMGIDVENFSPTFENSVAIDLYYPYSEDNSDDVNSAENYPSYGVLHSDFKTDSSNISSSDNSEKDTVSPTDNVSVTKSFEIFTKGDKLIFTGDKYCTIYGISETFKNNADSYGNDFKYDYVIYVPMENIFDTNGNPIGSVIADIIEVTPSLTMTVYYDGTELETFPVQIYADKVVIYGLETTNIYN